MNRNARQTGFSLIEVLIASTILAGVTAGLVMPFSLAAEHQQLDARRTTAATLLSQMMERLTVKSYDGILAMDGYRESGGQITGPAGEPLNDPSLSGFTITVTAAEQPIPVGGQTEQEASVFCLATVSVSHPTINTVSVSRLFAR